MTVLGRLIRIDAREVWTHEAHDFTPWLHANLPLLAEALGFDIEATGREVAVGDFAVDIVGRTTPGGRPVIVENQLAPTDHSHLGQVITYASGLDAAIIVWVAPRFRDEHRQAMDWLNSHTDEQVDFFGVELELLRINDSVPAPHFKLVAQPNAWAKSTKEAAAVEPSERGLRYQRFFEVVLAEFKVRRPSLTSTNRVGTDSYLGFAAGRTGFSFVWTLASGGRARIEVYIDTGEQSSTKAYFDALKAHALDLEAQIEAPIEWERLDNRRASRIATYFSGPMDSPVDENVTLRAWAIEMMVRWTDALRPLIKSLPTPSQLAVDPGVASGTSPTDEG